MISRRDRDDGRMGGGVDIFALVPVASNVVPILISSSAERIWCVLHSGIGPFLICCWYRPPCRGEILSIPS